MKLVKASLVVATAIGTTVLAANPALAQEADTLGSQGTFVIGAERLMGLQFHKETEAKLSVTSIALLGNAAQPTPSSIPRLGFDYLVTDGLTIGGALMFLSSSSKVDDVDQGSNSFFYVNPRIGYAYSVDDTFAIWPRVGFAYGRSSEEIELNDPATPNPETTISTTQLTLEGNLAISPVEHFAFIGGPFLDLGLGGTGKTEQGSESFEGDIKYTSYGLNIGVAGYF
jgi:hypothetical protein